MPIRPTICLLVCLTLLIAACNVSDPRLDEPIPDGLDSTELDASSDGRVEDTSSNDCSAECPAPSNAVASSCADGDCSFVCKAGFLDTNRDLPSGTSGNGCETLCSETNGGTEICDDQDNDCDGRVDEGLVRTCGSTDMGPCQYGEEVCRDGAWSDCEGVVEPEDEVCDDVDNDCDGRIDENLTRVCGTSTGACKEGEEECRNGTWGPCAGDIEPSQEFCNNADDDCDGSVDEDVKVEYYEDNDGDGWGTNPILACGPSGNHNALRGGDCDDTDENRNPGAVESCYDSTEDRDCDNKAACDDDDCDGKSCNANGSLGTCTNGNCVVQ